MQPLHLEGVWETRDASSAPTAELDPIGTACLTRDVNLIFSKPLLLATVVLKPSFSASSTQKPILASGDVHDYCFLDPISDLSGGFASTAGPSVCSSGTGKSKSQLVESWRCSCTLGGQTLSREERKHSHVRQSDGSTREYATTATLGEASFFDRHGPDVASGHLIQSR